MTSGHTHRVVRLQRTSTRYRLLQIRLASTPAIERAETSRFVWRDEPDGTYSLRVIGLLHTLTGLTVEAR